MKDEVGRGTAGGPDEPIAPAAVQRQLSGRRRPIMIDQLSAAAARLPGGKGRGGKGGGKGLAGGGGKGRGLQVGVVRPGPADRSGTAPGWADSESESSLRALRHTSASIARPSTAAPGNRSARRWIEPAGARTNVQAQNADGLAPGLN